MDNVEEYKDIVALGIILLTLLRIWKLVRLSLPQEWEQQLRP